MKKTDSEDKYYSILWKESQKYERLFRYVSPQQRFLVLIPRRYCLFSFVCSVVLRRVLLSLLRFTLALYVLA